MSVLKILAIPPDTHGVGKYRILDPFKYISEHYKDVHVDFSIKPENNNEFFLDYDIVVFHSFIHPTSREDNINRINWLKSVGIKVIMDIDDFWKPYQKHPQFFEITKSKTPEHKVELMKIVDFVTTTTEFFANTIRKNLGLKNVVVFPNAVDENEPQFKPNTPKSDKIRFGWLGGSSHLIDLELLQKGVATTLNAYHDKIQFVLCGFDTRGTINELNPQTKQIVQRNILPKETCWYKYELIFTDNYNFIDDDYKNYLNSFLQVPYEDFNKTYRRKWTENIDNYAFNYNNFDISLAPLVNNQFNNNKSQLKVIEAGFHKKALIASEVMPYTIDLINSFDNGKFNEKGNALLVAENRDHKQWAQHMKKLIENPNLIEDLGNKLYETVKIKYSLKKVSEDRVQFFKTIK